MLMELVLLARIALGGAAASSSANSARLTAFVLEDRLDRQVDVTRGIGQRRHHSDAAELLQPIVGCDLALGHGTLEVRADARAPGLGAGHLRFVERDLVSGRGQDLGDAVAHEARAAHQH